MSDITLDLKFRVTDRRALLGAALEALKAYPEIQNLDDVAEMSDEDLAEIVISERTGPWFLIGLQVLDD